MLWPIWPFRDYQLTDPVLCFKVVGTHGFYGASQSGINAAVVTLFPLQIGVAISSAHFRIVRIPPCRRPLNVGGHVKTNQLDCLPSPLTSYNLPLRSATLLHPSTLFTSITRVTTDQHHDHEPLPRDACY